MVMCFLNPDWILSLWACWALIISYFNVFVCVSSTRGNVLFFLLFLVPKCLTNTFCTQLYWLFMSSNSLMLSSLIRSILKIKSYHESCRTFVEKSFAHMPWSVRQFEMFSISAIWATHFINSISLCSINPWPHYKIWSMGFELWSMTMQGNVYFLFEVLKPNTFWNGRNKE